MAELRAVAVYCGSRVGARPSYADAARTVGRALAARGIRLVYGGGSVGLMGILADAALQAGGEVHGVITQALVEREVQHDGLTCLDVVETMHERKARMVAASDAVMVLPGGLGTLDELFEAATWTQLGIHHIPCGVLDVEDFYAPLRQMLDAATAQEFVRTHQRDIVMFDQRVDVLLERLAAWHEMGPPTPATPPVP